MSDILIDNFRRFTADDEVTVPNGYVMALEAILGKCADLRARGLDQYAEEFEQIFTDHFDISRDQEYQSWRDPR